MTCTCKAPLGVLVPLLLMSVLLMMRYRYQSKTDTQNEKMDNKIQQQQQHGSVRRTQVGGLMSIYSAPEDYNSQLNGKAFDGDYSNDDYTDADSRIDNDSDEDNIDKEDDNEVQKIISGKDTVERGTYPFMAMLRRPTGHLHCGGALIAPNIVLSAAHCQKGFDQVVLGAYNLNDPNQDEISYEISEILVHPDFNANNFDYDFMLVRLETGNDTSTSLSVFDPIEINNGTEEINNGDTLKVIGWGKMRDGTMAKILQELDVNALMDNQHCNDEFVKQNQIPGVFPSMICARADDETADTCKGDSGGPMFKETDDSTNILIGVVSWGYGKCGGIGVYSRVSEVYDWIQGFISKSS